MKVPLIERPTLFVMGEGRPQRAGQGECAGGAAAEDGATTPILAKAFAAKMPNAKAEVIQNAGRSCVSRGRAENSTS